MPDWLKDAALIETPLSAGTMALRLGIAALLGVIVGVAYRLSHGRLARDAQTLFGTLVLLTILLAMVTMVIGDSVARAFGLVGALSIVRFRTIVEDTRDTAFVIFAVVVGMAVGTGLVLVAVVGVPIVGVAALALTSRRNGERTAVPDPISASTLTVRLGSGVSQNDIEKLLGAQARAWRLAGVATARQGAAADYAYSLHLADSASASSLVAAINGLAGVQSVEFRADGPTD